MSQVYVVYHETFEETNCFFFSEAEAIAQIKENVSDPKYSSDISSWKYRIIREGIPFHAILSEPDYGDISRRLMNGDQFRDCYEEPELHYHCYMTLIADILGLTKREIVNQIASYYDTFDATVTFARWNTEYLLQAYLGDSEIIDNLRVCSILYSIHIELCTFVDDDTYTHEKLTFGKWEQDKAYLHRFILFVGKKSIGKNPWCLLKKKETPPQKITSFFDIQF